jgi:hypothetical protein
VPGGNGWYVLGEFYLGLSSPARIDAIGAVSQGGLSASVRLFDCTAGAPLSQVAAFSSTNSTRALSSVLQLTGGHRYQLQAQCTGAEDDAAFAFIQSATLSD